MVARRTRDHGRPNAAKPAHVVVLDPTDNPALHSAAVLAADTMRSIGMTVDVQAMDWSTLTVRRASRAPATQGGWNAFVTNATVTGISSPLLNNYAKNCSEAWYGWPCDQRIVSLGREWPTRAIRASVAR